MIWYLINDIFLTILPASNRPNFSFNTMAYLNSELPLHRYVQVADKSIYTDWNCTFLTWLNPFTAESTFIEGTRTQKILKIISILSCWYSLESPHWVLSDEYPFARVSVIFQLFSHYFVMAKLATSIERVKWYYNSHLISYGVLILLPTEI